MMNSKWLFLGSFEPMGIIWNFIIFSMEKSYIFTYNCSLLCQSCCSFNHALPRFELTVDKYDEKKIFHCQTLNRKFTLDQEQIHWCQTTWQDPQLYQGFRVHAVPTSWKKWQGCWHNATDGEKQQLIKAVYQILSMNGRDY